MANSETIDRVLEMLMAAYPGFGERTDPSKLAMTVNLYHASLADMPDDLLEAATTYWISLEDWFPTVAQLRKAATNIVTYARPSAEAAWGEVKRAMKMVGSYGVYMSDKGEYRDPIFPDAVLNATIKVMGWKTICMANVDDEVANRAHFMRIYGSLEGRANEAIRLMPATKNAMHQLADQHMAALTERLSNPKQLSLKGA